MYKLMSHVHPNLLTSGLAVRALCQKLDCFMSKPTFEKKVVELHSQVVMSISTKLTLAKYWVRASKFFKICVPSKNGDCELSG